MFSNLIEELKNSSFVEISYGIDRNANISNNLINILTSDDKLPPVDVVVVTPVLEFDMVKEELCNKVKASFISLEEILNEMV